MPEKQADPFRIDLKVGETYEIGDSLGMLSFEGVFLGPACPQYVDLQGERYEDTYREMAVFSLPELYGGDCPYAGVQSPKARFYRNSIVVELVATHYGKSVETLKPPGYTRQLVGWKMRP